MARYVCAVCGYVHDDAAGEPFEGLPDRWTCPVCGAVKSMFEPAAEAAAPVLAPDLPAPGTAAKTAAGTTASVSTSGAAIRERRKRVLRGHRVFGYVFVAIYLILILQMVPRLWSYQIEFPPRTVVHIALGMAVGILLLVKVGIVRYFRRLEKDLVPQLGTCLLVCSTVLIGISVPWAFQEAYATATLLTPSNRLRVETLLAQAGLEPAQCRAMRRPVLCVTASACCVRPASTVTTCARCWPSRARRRCGGRPSAGWRSARR